MSFQIIRIVFRQVWSALPQRDSNDRMFRSKILQMRMEHPEEKIDIVCRLRNFENAFVFCLSTSVVCDS